MIINRHNYEVFLVDYLDGNLNPSLVGDLLRFLELNPDLKNEFDGLEGAVLEAESILYPYKSDLKKKSFLKNGIDDEQEYRYIASIEGVLTEDEQFKLKSEANLNEEIKKSYSLYKETIIQPSTKVTFPNKARLKRARIVPIRYSTLRNAVSVAASIGLILGLYSIGKLLVTDKQIVDISKDNIIAIDNNPRNTTLDIKASNRITYSKTNLRDKNLTATNTKVIYPETLTEDIVARKEEFIPNMMAGIESQKIVISKNLQYEQVAQSIEDYSRHKDINNEYTRVEPINPIANSNYREIGLFEIIQYGVQSFGKLIRKDIQLKAKKDKNGRIEKISFESDLVAFSTQIRKKE